MKIFILAFPILWMLSAINPVNEQQIQKETMKNEVIYELAINQAKEGQYDRFIETRKKFVDILGKQSETLDEGKWNPFYTVAPDLDLEQILIGMTEWKSMQAFGETAGRLMPQQVTKDYFASFNPLAYALLSPVDGKEFDFASIKKAGNVVEFAIRKGKTDNAFGGKRDAFFKSLESYDGYKFAREFTVYALDESGMPTLQENTQAVIIVWESPEQFQAAAQPIFGSDAYQAFSANLDVQSYFASTPVK